VQPEAQPRPGRAGLRAARDDGNQIVWRKEVMERRTLCALSVAALLASQNAIAAGPTITGASFAGTNAALTLTISGGGFGSAPPGALCKSCTTLYINIGGRIGCFDKYNIVSWTDDRIVLSGLQANPGNQILISVTSTLYGTVTVLSTAINNSIRLALPKISTVTFVGSGRHLRMTITGSGFGATPPGIHSEGDLPFFLFTILPLNSAQWSAGYIGCGDTDAVSLDYASWSPTKIVISGFGEKYGKGPSSANHWQVFPGDIVTIAVANSATNGLKIGYSSNPPTYVPFVSPLGTGAVWSGQLP
jgi:hypothetical protein